jgi:protein transport protein SEC31
MQRVKARAPEAFKVQVNDTEKRLNVLFDNLNNQTLLKPNTVADMVRLAEALQAKNYDAALAVQTEIMTNRTDECGAWMVSLPVLSDCPIA